MQRYDGILLPSARFKEIIIYEMGVIRRFKYDGLEQYPVAYSWLKLG